MKRHPEEELNVKMFKDKKTIVSARYFIMRQCVEPVAHDKYKRHGKMCELRKAFRMLKECNVPFRTEDEIDAMEALIELRMKE